MERIYLDNSAASRVDAGVLEAMLPYFTAKYGNASSLHMFGAEAKDAMEAARTQAAALINAKPEEIIFTSGGTESDNLAIKGIAAAKCGKGDHIITTNIEHPAVLEPCRYLERLGYKVTYARVGSDGIVDANEVAKAITDKTILISVMHANNEIGTIQPVEEIGKIARERGITFHTDAVQTAGKIPVDVEKLGVSLLSISAHKLHGPKGAGILYVREGTPLEPLLHGGGHENGLRSGTENIPGIVGTGKACEVAKRDLVANAAHMLKLRDRLIGGLLTLDEAHLNGSRERRLPNNANIRFLGIEGEALVLLLGEKGIAASTGSACSSKKLQASHVLLALGLPEWQTHGSLRLTLSKYTTAEEIDRALAEIPPAVARLRAMSPVWKKLKAGEKIGHVKEKGHAHMG